MSKSDVLQKERDKLTAIFADVEPSKRQLVEGLIEDAAFLAAENHELRERLRLTGMVKVHPQHPEIQKPVEAGRQYRQNVMAYAVVIKALNGVLTKNLLDEDENELEEFV